MADTAYSLSGLIPIDGVNEYDIAVGVVMRATAQPLPNNMYGNPMIEDVLISLIEYNIEYWLDYYTRFHHWKRESSEIAWKVIEPLRYHQMLQVPKIMVGIIAGNFGEIGTPELTYEIVGIIYGYGIEIQGELEVLAKQISLIEKAAADATLRVKKEKQTWLSPRTEGSVRGLFIATLNNSQSRSRGRCSRQDS